MSAFFGPFPALRLLIIVCCGIPAGVFTGVSLSFWVTVAAVLVAGLVLLAVFNGVRSPFGGLPSPPELIVYHFLVFCVFAAYSQQSYRYVAPDSVLRYLDKDVLVYGRVMSRPKRSERGYRWILEASRVSADGAEEMVSGRLQVFLRSEGDELAGVEPGDMIWLKGRPRPIQGAQHPGGFDAREYYRLQGVRATVYLHGAWLMENHGPKGRAFFETAVVRPLRQYLDRSIGALVRGEDERRFFSGVLLGERDELDGVIREQFRKTGTAHVLAISGLHVGLLVVLVLVVLQRLRKTSAGRWAVFLVVVSFLAIYCQVTGNAPSVRRASLMTVILLGGTVTGRKVYPLNSLAAADLVILARDPLELWQAGFLMTNAAVMSIILLYPVLMRPAAGWHGLTAPARRFLWGSFSVSLAAMAGVSPLIAHFFGTFSLIGIVANLPVVMLVSLMLYAIVPGLVLGLVSSHVAHFFGESASALASLTLAVTQLFSTVSWGVLDWKPGAGEVVLFYVTLLAGLRLALRRRWRGVVTVLLLSATVVVWAGGVQ
ncbi:ComEC family competence protein [Prosthecochloris sp. ZM_2]|uniref:ComEC/Rec2 family competence protein n=1 Tax=Prosthecochloris sp. ZM_2 TaxID=2045206 RepID=UPI000DF7939C|nr:ComEC/Rec2 family competence protein [Prosthecochloris sp. ZM_2]RNA64685.1 ComEC family competence protein [Prosthecochloris sp. ZM_2]